jgi:protein-disulfide isomerase
MQTTRRTFIANTFKGSTGLAVTGALLATPALIRPARADDTRLAQRFDGPANAPNVVEEWFSFTCPHCARFAADVYPEIKAKLVDTGKVKYVFCEFPRDKLDLAAAMVARSLPASRYEPFVMALLAGQMQWAFNREADPMDELAKEAALAGMPRTAFDQATNDEALRTALLDAQTEAEKKYNIDSTPTFIVNGKAHPGEMTFAEFAALVGVKV